MTPDQRYCLNCGARRDGAPVPFREALAVGPGGAGGQAMMPTVYQFGAPTAATSNPALLTSLAAVACVLLAFGVGFLVADRGGKSQVAAAPQVITQTAATPAAAADTTSTEKSADSSESSKDSSSESSSKPVSKAEIKKVEKKAETELKPTKETEVKSKSSIAKSESAKDPEAAAQASKDMPDVVVTGK